MCLANNVCLSEEGGWSTSEMQGKALWCHIVLYPYMLRIKKSRTLSLPVFVCLCLCLPRSLFSIVSVHIWFHFAHTLQASGALFKNAHTLILRGNTSVNHALTLQRRGPVNCAPEPWPVLCPVTSMPPLPLSSTAGPEMSGLIKLQGSSSWQYYKSC